MRHMRVDSREVEFAGKQEDHGTDRAEAAIAARSTLGGLEQSVQCLKEDIGLSGLCPGDDALEVVSDHPSDLLHGLDLGAHDVGAPLPEHVGDDIDLFAPIVQGDIRDAGLLGQTWDRDVVRGHHLLDH